MNKILNDSDKELIRAMILRGNTMADIAKIITCHVKTVYRVREEMDLPRELGTARPWPKILKAAAAHNHIISGFNLMGGKDYSSNRIDPLPTTLY